MSVHGGWNNIFFFHEGKILGVGKNENCQLGQGYKEGNSSSPDKKNRSLPVEIKIPGNPRIILFKTGVFSRTTVVLTTKGLYGCGQGDDGQFGDDSYQDRPQMKIIEFYKGKAIDNYFPEGFALWVVLRNFKVFRSGWGTNGDLGNGNSQNISVPEELKRDFMTSTKERVIHITGYAHTVLLTDEGNVYVCGDGRRGRLGLGQRGIKDAWDGVEEFERLKMFGRKKQVHVVSISTGSSHTVFLAKKNLLYSCWSCGCGEWGQLGHNDNEDRSVPTLIESFQKKKIRKNICGYHFSLFLTRNFTVYGCGDNEEFQMEVPTSCGSSRHREILVPTKFETKNLRIIDVATTWYSTTLLTSSGEVYSVGRNEEGQCCLGKPTIETIKTLTKAKIRLTVKLDGTNLTVLFGSIPKKLTDAIVRTCFEDRIIGIH